jgi:TPR repeat protein
LNVFGHQRWRNVMKAFAALASVLLFVAASLSAGTAQAGTADDDFRRGLSAFNTGDYVTALRLWRSLAESGEPRSQAGIGYMYHRGLGVGVDDREAAVWLRRAAELGQAEGQLMLGILFYYGQGVPQSYVRAYAWCELAETGGNGDATLCRDAALESLASDAEREEAFRLVVDLSERYGLRR